MLTTDLFVGILGLLVGTLSLSLSLGLAIGLAFCYFYAKK